MRSKLRILILFFIIILSFGLAYAAIDSVMLPKLGRPVFSLTVTKSGTGSGTVTSDVFNINCGVLCSQQIPMGTVVTLTATPDAGDNAFNGWTGSGCSGTSTCVIVMNGNKTVDASFVPGIPRTSMWAWWKTNEGSGTTIIDYSPTAANGTLVDGTAGHVNFFWNTNPGFGTSSNNVNFNDGVTRSSPGADTTYCSLVAFIRPLGIGFPQAYQGAVQLGESGTGNFISIGWQDDFSPNYWFLTLRTGSYLCSTIAPVSYGTWYCVYAFSQANSTNTGFYVRKAGDVNWTLARSGDSSGAAGAPEHAPLFLQGPTTISVSGGDALYWASSSPTGIISLTQATNTFNILKSRYPGF